MIAYKFKLFVSNSISKILSKYPYKILNTEQTLNYIISNNCSLSRFGEGELRMIKKGFNTGYQNADEELVKRLKEIIKSNSTCEIGIPYALVSYKHMNKRGQEFWKNYLSYGYIHNFIFINKRKLYLDAQVTRFYIDFEDKELSKKYIGLWRKIWDNREIVFVEGDKTRLGIGNDFFSNAKSIERIVCPAENAWNKYKDILDSCKTVQKNKLLLIALGPTASVLAYDLALCGYQAIDVGHLDIEYEWYTIKADNPVAIENKYTNEAKGGNEPSEMTSNAYEQQIIWRV